MAYESYCAACTYLNERADSSGKYYCTRKGEDHYATDPKCYSFCEAYSRSNSSRSNMYDNSKSHSGGGCYITTAMCTILGYRDDNYYLQILRTFRDNVLKKDTKYFPLLLMYDTIGPQIAENLMNDPNNKIIAQTLFTKYIEPAVTAIENNKNNTATNIYTAMTHSLSEKYNINTNIITTEIDELDIESLGHARKRILPNQ